MSTKPTSIKYTATATAEGGRDGRVSSDDNILDVNVTPPPEMGGKGGTTNPEQLFAAGYGACFQGALFKVSQAAGADISGSEVTAKVGIGPNDTGGFGLKVDLTVALPNVQRDEAEKLVEQAHQVCPYSNATRGNIDVTLTVA